MGVYVRSYTCKCKENILWQLDSPHGNFLVYIYQFLIILENFISRIHKILHTKRPEVVEDQTPKVYEDQILRGCSLGVRFVYQWKELIGLIGCGKIRSRVEKRGCQRFELKIHFPIFSFHLNRKQETKVHCKKGDGY